MYENKIIAEINGENVEINTSSIRDNGEAYVHFYSGKNRYCSIIMPDDKIWMKMGYSEDEMENIQEWLNDNRTVLWSMAKGTEPLSHEQAALLADLILGDEDDEDEWDDVDEDWDDEKDGDFDEEPA